MVTTGDQPDPNREGGAVDTLFEVSFWATIATITVVGIIREWKPGP